MAKSILITNCFQVKSAIIRAETEMNVSYSSLTNHDWGMMVKVADYLKPFADLTNMASAEHACVAEVIPYVKLLFFKLEKLPRRGVCRLRQELIAETTRYFRGGDTRDHFPDIESKEEFSLATLLDPRFKKSGFSSASKAEAATEKLLLAAEEVEVNQSAVAASTAPPVVDVDDDWNACMNIPCSSSTDEQSNDNESGPSNCTVEIEEYLAEKNLGRTDSPFSYWAGNKKRYPRLAALARKYLSAPMASIASEREFKIAKQVTNNRGTLKPSNVEVLLFLKYNLRMLNYQY